MSWRWLAAGMTTAAGAVWLQGCAATCNATDQKLASLRRGMSYAEAIAVMGCTGRPLPAAEDSAVSSREWNGPGLTMTATQLDFLDGQLLYYTVQPRGGL